MAAGTSSVTEDFGYKMTNVTDNEGNSIPAWQKGDMFLSRMILNPDQRLKELADFEGMSGDALICSFPKTGLHWTFDLLQLLWHNSLDTELSVPLDDVLLEITPDLESLKHRRRPMLAATHLHCSLVPEGLLKNGKIILIHRNPKDTALSFYHFISGYRILRYKGALDVFLKMFLDGKTPYGSYFDYYHEWDKLMKENPGYKILPIKYEDLHKDNVGTLRKICDFIGIERSDQFLESVAERCNLKKLRKEKEIYPALQKYFAESSDEGSNFFYRKGIVGDWVNYLTIDQSKEFDRVFKEKLGDTQFAIDRKQ